MMNTKSFLVDLKILFQIVTYRSNLEIGQTTKNMHIMKVQISELKRKHAEKGKGLQFRSWF